MSTLDDRLQAFALALKDKLAAIDARLTAIENGTVLGGGTGGSGGSVGSRWAALKANALAGTSGGVLACVGDSTTTGVGGVTYQDSYPYKLAQDLLNEGLPVIYSGFSGQTTWLTDSRLSFTGSPAQTGFTKISPGYLVTAGLVINFLEPHNVDTFDIYYLKGSDTGTANVSINGGSTIATISTNGLSSINKLTVTAALGANTLHITGVSGNVYVQNVDAYDSNGNKIRVLGFGFPAKQSNWFSGSAAYDPIQALSALQPALTIFDIGINDWENNVPTASYNANVQSFISGISGFSDIMLVGPNHTGGVASDDQQSAYDTELQNIATANKFTFKDIRSISANWTNYVDANAAGLMSDTLHPNAGGYGQIANFLAGAL